MTNFLSASQNILFAGLLLLCSFASSSAVASKSASKEFADFLQSIKTIEANYAQKIHDVNNNLIDESQGKLYLKQGHQFRSEVLEPYRQDVISNGNKLWFIDHDLEQVNVSILSKKSAALPLVFLTGDISELEKEYQLSIDTNKELGLTTFVLVAKDSSNAFKEVRIGRKSKTLLFIELDNQYENNARIDFSEVRVNKALSPKLFSYEAQAGYDLIDNTVSDIAPDSKSTSSEDKHPR